MPTSRFWMVDLSSRARSSSLASAAATYKKVHISTISYSLIK